jgi:hypothetical protein
MPGEAGLKGPGRVCGPDGSVAITGGRRAACGLPVETHDDLDDARLVVTRQLGHLVVVES